MPLPSQIAGQTRNQLHPTLAALALLLLLSACASSGSHFVSTPMTRERVIADMDFAMAAMNEVHPNLNWRASSSVLDRRRQELIAALPAAPSAIDVYVTMRQLTSAANDAHVAIADVPDGLIGGDGLSLTDQFSRSGGELNILLDPNAEGMTISEVRSGNRVLRPGDVIESINGQPAASILTRLEGLMPGSDVTKHRGARAQLGRMLWLVGIRAPYDIVIRSPGATATQRATIFGNLRHTPVGVFETTGQPIDYKLLPDGIGLIGFYDMSGDRDEFVRLLAEIYIKMLNDRPRGVIIDIRENPGGNSMLGQMLLALVSDKPYRPFSERHWKVSQTCKNYFRTLDRDDVADLFDKYMEEPPGKILVDPVNADAIKLPHSFYRGPVAALIGPDTYSSAEILADAMKTYNLAELFGQPTSEPANQYGEVCRTVLPNSGITLAAPSALFIRADGNAETAEPVVPHHLIPPGPARPGLDPALEAARRWLATQPPGTVN